MLFNSLEFLFFFGGFMASWRATRALPRARLALLTLSSFFFYGWWDWRFLPLLLLSGVVDFLAALAIGRYRKRRGLFLGLSLAVNLGLLGTFKYADFFIDNVNTLGLGAIGHLDLVLPVGISFYTFQSLSYTIDVYRGQVEPTRDPIHFFAYLSMFPQLVAGPIVRAADLLPQLQKPKEPDEAARWDATRLIIRGFFKKVVVADNLANIVNVAFAASDPPTGGLYWWVVMAFFAMQIYCDFSGYSDIAIGIGRLMGVQFPVNFRHPYTALGLRDFWQRWHISLSTWFQDYVYIPLGGSRGGRLRSDGNMWVTMVTSGIWHGASWQFVIWGAIHAAALSVERATGWPKALGDSRLGKVLGVAVTLVVVLLAWVFFRAESIEQSFSIIQAMFRPGVGNASFFWAVKYEILLVALVFGRGFLAESGRAERWRSARFEPLVYAVLVAACVFLRGPGQSFIYFQF